MLMFCCSPNRLDTAGPVRMNLRRGQAGILLTHLEKEPSPHTAPRSARYQWWGQEGSSVSCREETPTHPEECEVAFG